MYFVFRRLRCGFSRPAKRIRTARTAVKSRWQQRESSAEDGNSQTRAMRVFSAASPLERYINLG
jgi:hypothetical protein